MPELPAYHVVYTDAEERIGRWKFELREMRPNGADISLDGWCITFDCPMRLSARRIGELVDANTGELIADALDHFLCRWLEAQRGADGRVPLLSFVDALPLNGAGPVASAAIAAAFGTWEAFWTAARAAAAEPHGEAWRAIDAHVSAAFVAELAELCGDPARCASIERLVAAYLPAPAVAVQGALAGRRVVFTGELATISRGEARRRAESQGAVVATTVNRKTHLLVVGAEPGSKLDKARALGVAITDEAGFLDLVGGASGQASGA